MELATCCSSSALLGTKFRCMFAPNDTDTTDAKKNKTNRCSVPLLNGCSKAMAMASPSSSSSSPSVWNGRAGSGSFGGATSTSSRRNNGRIYTRRDSCLVIPPPNGKKPRAIIKFLGGAFIGAVPELTYRLPLCSMLKKKKKLLFFVETLKMNLFVPWFAAI